MLVMAKNSGTFFLSCLLSLVCGSSALFETHSCKTIVKYYAPVCLCYPVEGVKMVCKGLLEYSEFSGIMQSLRERHNSIKIELKNGGENMRVLTNLQIVHGTLEKIYEHEISQIGFVKTLNFSFNALNELEKGFLVSLAKNLSHLDLSNNNITSIEDYFKDNASITEMNFSRNKVHQIDSMAFRHTPNLEILDLSQNQLTKLDEYLFDWNGKIQILNLSYNFLNDLSPETFQGLTNLHLLDLASNTLFELDPNLFTSLVHLAGLDLTKNQLSALTPTHFRNNTKLRKVLILGNPLRCDKELEWLYLRVSAKELDITSEASSWKFNNHTIFCAGGPDDMKDKTLHKWLSLTGIIKSFHNCSTCKFCDCYIDRDRIGAVVDCSQRNLTHLPKDLPHNTLSLNLTDNNIRTIKIHPEYVSRWQEVRKLILDGNEIESLGALEGQWKMKLIFSFSLTRNRLQEVPLHLLDQFVPQLSEFFLSNNPWMCDCNTVRFKAWLIRYHQQIKDLGKMNCGFGNVYHIGKPITSLENQELCPQSDGTLNYLDGLNIVMAVLIVVILTKLAYDYWYRKRTGKFPRFFKLRIK